MSTNLFDLINYPLVGNEIVIEHHSPTIRKTKEFLFPVENCDDFFEILQGRLKDNESSDQINYSSILVDLPNCNTVLKKGNILGEYYSKTKHIEYYKQTPKILEITKIHERFHAVHHLTLDKNGAIWNEFPIVSSFFKELLAQLFTWIHIRDNNSNLTQDFRDLNSKQPLIYQTYKIFQHYDSQQAEDLYWDVRNMKFNANNKIIRFLDTLLNLFNLKNTSVMPAKKIVPSTKLRALYEALKSLHLSTDTQKCIMQDLLRKGNHKGLVNLFDESYNHIESTYDNINEPIFSPNAKRKPIIGTTSIKSTNDIISQFLSNNKVIVDPPEYDFDYIEREVSPLRTSNAIYANNLPARRSGTGGLDFIGWNTLRNLPVLGEIKVRDDQNPFYALIQLLTYLSEISTPKQIDRINNYKHFGPANSLSTNTKFYLYIISCRQLNPKKKYDLLLPDVKVLVKNIVPQIKQIEDILFFHLDLNTKVITQE
jgi:hypothetical protein